jgi:hypothetical protein
VGEAFSPTFIFLRIIMVKESVGRIYRDNIRNIAPLISAKTGNVVCPDMNPLLKRIIPYQMVFDESGGDSVVAVAANGTATARMSVDESGPVLVEKFKGNATDTNYTVNIFDTQYQRYLMNRPIHAETIIGTGPFPFELPEPFLVNRNHALITDITNLSVLPNNIRHNFESYRFYYDKIEEELFYKMSEANKISRNYFYTTNTEVSLAVGGAIQTFQLKIINDADFMMYRITTKQDGAFRVKMQNLATGYSFSNSWVHSADFGGNSRNYMDFRVSVLMPRRSEIKFDFINLGGAGNRVFITLTGMNYYLPG